MEDDATQLTQNVLDPRRTEGDFSTAGIPDIADVICILHPCTPAAFGIATRTAARRPQHVFQAALAQENEGSQQVDMLDEQGTFILPDNQSQRSLDLALRFSSATVCPGVGFLFGRSPNACDFFLDADTIRRVSNIHFRIFLNESGVLMLQDLSTNGTVVDDVLLKGKLVGKPQTRMLKSGSMIQVLSPQPEEVIKFIVRIPSREGHEEQFTDYVKAYLELAAAFEQRPGPETAMQRLIKAVPRAPPTAGRPGGLPTTQPTLPKQETKWDGGSKYNIAGIIGKGAFAMVYLLATKAEGHYYAAKELEKRRFMKDGILDRKLDNEMQIMKELVHRHIVQYIDYVNHKSHLYIIMEYVGCGDLQGYIAAKGHLAEPLAKTMAAQVFDALTYLHNKKITHRDIKPDNLLIADDSPQSFWIKLSDFGLSKVVKDSGTFLKTFCGTLLYCAPEVFPYYDQHNGRKRTRRTGTNEPRRYHSYSHTVDIWSFGAVIWYSLCGKVPFDGVLDNTGQGMFQRIMNTPLNPTPLLQVGTPPLAIDLLSMMLNTDPAERPDANQCRQHPWFADVPDNLEFIQNPTGEANQLVQNSLTAVGEGAENDQNIEPEFSQLRIEETHLADQVEVSLDSSDLDFLNPRESKRFKHYESPGQAYPSSDISPRHGLRSDLPGAMPRRPLLFAEIGGSLQNPSAFQLQSINAASLSIREIIDAYGEPDAAKSPLGSAMSPTRQHASVTSPENSSTSLSGTELMVKELNVDSPQSSHSLQVDSDDPHTPRTPAEPRPSSSLGQTDGSQETPGRGMNTTPKIAPFSRRIDLPLSASFFYDPHDPTTHNPEYASARSGHDFLAQPTALSSSFSSMAHEPRRPSDATIDDQQGSGVESSAEPATAPVLERAPEFLRPAPRLGRLTSTPDSFADITIPLSSRITTWGRARNNTAVFPNGEDVRVPKRGLILYFNASEMDKADASDKDWTKLSDLHCLVATEARSGIAVNGVKLTQKNSEGRFLFGRVYSGDVLTIAVGQKGKIGDRGSGLAFQVEIFHGQSKEPRREDKPFEIEIDKRSK